MLGDLRGITSATHGRRTYGLLFEALYPAYFPVFQRTAEAWADDPQVMTALLKFLQEFAYNKAQRVQFEQSSANGILLFREISNIVCAYGSRIMDIPVQQDIWIEKYKGIRLMLNVLTCALSGNYVNFGVFALYNDKALENALDVSLQLCLNIPLADAISYTKLSKAYFAFVEILFRNHLDVLANLDSPVFLQLVRTVHEGLQVNGEDLPICAFSASAIDHLATYIFLNQRKDKPTVQLIRAHVATDPGILTEMMTTLFNQLLFGSNSNQWAISRPILSLMLASEDVRLCCCRCGCPKLRPNLVS
jgi:exportin-7